MKKKPLEPHIIIDKVCEYYNIPSKSMFSKERFREVVTPRQMCQTLLKENTGLSLSSIGVITGMRNHATILHANKTIHNLIDTDKKIRSNYEDLIKRLYPIVSEPFLPLVGSYL